MPTAASSTSPPIWTELDLSSFDPKAPPPKTAAFWDIVNVNSAPEDADLADVLEDLVQSRRHHAGAADREGDWRGRRMAAGSKKSPLNSTPSRPLRLHLGAQSGDQRRTMEGAGQKASRLCQGQSELARPDGSSESAIGMMLPARFKEAGATSPPVWWSWWS